MNKRDKNNVNAPLDKGDKIMLWTMEGENLRPGLKGTVTGKNEVMGNVHYQVDWENGSRLDLLSDVDRWILVEKGDSTITEATSEQFKEMAAFIKNKGEFARSVDLPYLFKFLEKLRQCGVTNMLQSTQYLIMGRRRMEVDFEYHRVESEICDEVLEMADEARQKIISGAVKILDKQDKELTDENVRKIINKNLSSILQWFMMLK